MPVFTSHYESPIGVLVVSCSKEALLSVQFADSPNWIGERYSLTLESSPLLNQTTQQLKEYFEGQRRSFSIPLSYNGSSFYKKAWAALEKIPYGSVISYAEQARQMGLPLTSSRAVGAANGKNHIVIIVPCHRVIGSSGNLTGYGSGLWRKNWLLQHEGARFEKRDQLRLFS